LLHDIYIYISQHNRLILSTVVLYLITPNRLTEQNATMAACLIPEVVGNVFLGEGGVGRECQIDLQRGGAVDEVVKVHPRQAHGEPAQVLGSQRHGRRQPEPAPKIS
jgi:hypothetical protein